MNYKYGSAIVLGLFLAAAFMTKVASAALITYDITATTEDYNTEDWGVYFAGTVVIDSAGGTFQSNDLGADESLEYNGWVKIDGDVTDLVANAHLLTNRFTAQVDVDYDLSYAVLEIVDYGGGWTVRSKVGCDSRQDPTLYCTGGYGGDNSELVYYDYGGLQSLPLTFEATFIRVDGGGPPGPVGIPEPSTLAIFALGMIGLASRRFKKQS